MNVPSMNDLGEWNASDRVFHGYTYLYDEIFAPIRYSSVRIFEIGFARGRGTRMLAEFFPRGTVHAIDIEPDWQNYNHLTKELQKRVKLYQADQSDPDSIQRALQQIYDGPKNPAKRGYRQFDIIIDDGSHEPSHQHISFKKLWPEVAPGGLYIIEDFHPYYKDRKHETVSWLFDTVHKLNRYGDKNAKATLDIGWIMFAYNQAILRKPNE